MEKRQKIKRIFCLFSCFLFLCISLVGFIPSASAFSYVPDDPHDSDVYESLVPFDKFTLKNSGNWTIPNPLLSWHPDGVNDSSWIESNSLESLWVLSQAKDWTVDSTGEFLVQRKLTGLCSTVDGVHVVFSTSRPFVSTRPALIYFLNNFQVKLMEHYILKCSLTMKVKVPVLQDDGSYSLVSKTITGESIVNGEVLNGIDMYVPCIDYRAAGTSLYSFLANLGDLDVIVESIFLDVDIDYCNIQGHTAKCYSTYGVYFQTPYVLKGNFLSISGFYDKYPNQGIEYVYIYEEVDTMNFLASLKVGVSGFFGTEIIPGISFGGLLSVSIGIGLVVAFLKHFGG